MCAIIMSTMMRVSLLVFGFGAVLPVAAAQSSYQSPQFFLNAWRAVDDFPSDLPVSDGEWATVGEFEWQTVATDDPNVERPSMVKLQFKVIGDGIVSITATALFGQFDRYEPSMSNMRSETVATHSVKVNDLVSFPELEQFGIALQSYRLIPVQPDKPYRPRLESKAPSLTFEFAQIDRTMGKVIVHNHSDKAVVNVMVGNVGGQALGALSEAGRTLIAPGATYEFDSNAPFTGWCIKRVCGTEPMPLILEEAVFEDGSYEGDQTVAMEPVANWLGNSAEWKRIVSAAGSFMSDPNRSELGKMQSLASVVDALSIEPDDDTVARFRMRFPDLPAREIQRGEELLAMGMGMERDRVKTYLQMREEDLDRKTNTVPSTTEWWEHYAGR